MSDIRILKGDETMGGIPMFSRQDMAFIAEKEQIAKPKVKKVKAIGYPTMREALERAGF